MLKFHDPKAKGGMTLEYTVKAALQQIADRQYAASLEAKDIPAEKIWRYGFAFQRKKILIG